MPKISTQEFERLPLRVHEFLAGVPLHDVWAIDLPWVRSGITLDEFFANGKRPCLHTIASRTSNSLSWSTVRLTLLR